MEAMAFSSRCRLLAAGHAIPVKAHRFSSSSSLVSGIYTRFVRIRASSSSSSSPPVVESSSPASTSSSAFETVSEPESASISTLEIPPPAAATSTSLVARTPELVMPEGAAGLAQVNHYRILKIPYGSSLDQIAQAHEDRVEEVKILENEIGKKAADEKLRVLQVSYNILNSEEERKVYDWVLHRYDNRLNDSYIWPYETDITQRYSNKEPPPVMRSFDQEGNNKLGLFLIGWVIVSIIFSVLMKTWTPYPHWRNL